MVELSETYVLECEELDKDHRRLVEMVNEITDRLDSGDPVNCKGMVLEFVNFAKGHFGREEQFLTKVGYPDVGKHREHHRQLDEKMEHIVEFAESASVNEMARESLKKELVFFLMDDVITTDLDFKAFIGHGQD
ncbi:MAG: hemerythrin domain-containing protein [Rhodospirillales bacterium]